MRIGTWTSKSLFSAVTRFLSFSKDLCAICHKNEATHQIIGGKCCEQCHIKMARKKTGYVRKDEPNRIITARRVISVSGRSSHS